MIRQFGLPSFFITLSADESKWLELLVILKKTIRQEDISEKTANALEKSEVVELIRSDPLTCAWYFEFRYRKLLKLEMVPQFRTLLSLLIDFLQRNKNQQTMN